MNLLKMVIRYPKLLRIFQPLWLPFLTWTTPNTVIAGDVASASNHNTYIRDNLTYLLSGKAYVFSNYVGSADVTTTSTTFAAVDSTNVKFSITPASTRAFVCFLVFGGNSSGTSGSEWDIYSTTAAARLGHATHGIAAAPVNRYGLMTVPAIATGLTPGAANIFTLYHRSTVSGQTTTTYNNAWPITWLAWEM